MSSDEEDNFNSEQHSPGDSRAVHIASSLLFGNIDNDGFLTDDIFDEECKRHLGSLQRHLDSVVPFEELLEKNSKHDGTTSDGDDSDDRTSEHGSLENDQTINKDETAIDYSDINEFIEEQEPDKLLENYHSKPTIQQEDDDYDEPMIDKESTKLNETLEKNQFEKDKDGFTIPKAPCREEDREENTSSNEKLSDKQIEADKAEAKKRLHTPLAAMLPSKYADFDVTELFPEFRHNQVLRFSRLFGPGKSSSLPQIWKNVKNRRKNRQIFENKLFIVQSSQKGVSDRDKWHFDVCDPSEISIELIEEDDEQRLIKGDFIDLEAAKKASADNEENLNVAEWRYGPAQSWYDSLKVPENGEGFDYGFKLKMKDDQDDSLLQQDTFGAQNDPDDAFHMVTQVAWENDIIWNADKIRQKVLAKLNDKHLASGWLPMGNNRTAHAFNNMRATNTSKPTPLIPPSQPLSKKDKKLMEANAAAVAVEKTEERTWYSIFPIENEDLIYGHWEDEIIWDTEAMDRIPSPKLLTLDRNDDNIILEVPIDEEDSHIVSKPATTEGKEKHKKEKEPGIRKSRLLLGKAGVIAEPEIAAPPSPTSDEKDPFNISNDEYYSQKTSTEGQLKTNIGSNLIQHSIPALELRQPFFPTFLNIQRLRAHHRPPLKRYSHGAIADTLSHEVYPLVKHIKRKAKIREQERIASGGGEMFFMRTPEDLTGKDGDLILAEYSEEHPPLMSQVGMASKIKNYYKRKPGKDTGAPQYRYGETVYCHTSPFLGNMQPAQSLQALESNLMRAPIYEHQMPDTDFLVIRTRDNYYIREVETIYTVGQELPLYEVPGPNSKKANNFIRDFLQVFIYRLFWKSTDKPRRIKMEDIKKAFPAHSESSIRKRLKQCADFRRTGMDSNWWVLKLDFRLPSEDEIRAMVSPEACCAYYSMLAAEQRLKDAGYGEKSMFAPDDAEDEDTQCKMDDEVKAAPWNTSRAFISAMKGKCLLQLTGVADPTGCGEGFSYVRIPNKPQQSKEEAQKEPLPKKTVTGTDADLRRLPLNAAKQLLRKFGVPDEEIKKLSRWEVIDVVRTLSTKQAKQAGDELAEDDAMSKFARGNRFSIAEHQERYKEECQRIFDLQNRVLASTEDLSTDEEESEEEEDSEIEELGKNIESMLANKKTMNQISRDKEEEERRELKKLLLGEESNQGGEQSGKNKRKQDSQKDTDENDEMINLNATGSRILKIHRTYTNSDGKEYVRIETVRKSAVIDTYVRIRTTKDEAFIRQFASSMDDQQKEEKRKQKRRIQEQIRRLKRNQEKEKLATSLRNQYGMSSLASSSSFNINSFGSDLSFSSTKEPKVKKERPKKIKEEKNLTLKCGACGAVGHMRTNRACPLYNTTQSELDDTNLESEESSVNVLNEDNLVKVDETKLTLSKSFIKHLEEQQKQQSNKSKGLKLKIPKELLAMKRKRRAGTNDNCDYLQKPDYKSAHRRRTDPMVTLADIFEGILNDLRLMPETEPFHGPVNTRSVPDYYKIVQHPMDFRVLRTKIREKSYKNRSAFLEDINAIFANSYLYNGPNHDLTETAKDLMEKCASLIQAREDEIIKLEKAINPLLADDQEAFDYMLRTIIVEHLRSIPESRPFYKPVSKKAIKNYYDVIKCPMDLETMEAKVDKHLYKSREQFLKDLELIYENSRLFNGADSNFTLKAAELVTVAKEQLNKYQEKFSHLEKSINGSGEQMELGEFYDESNMGLDEEYDDQEPPLKQHRMDNEYGCVDDDGEMVDDDKSNHSSVFGDQDKDIADVADDLKMTPQNSGDESDDLDLENDNANQSWLSNASTLRTVNNQTGVNEEDNFDENYDPSEFLLHSAFAQQSQRRPELPLPLPNESVDTVDIAKDLDISDSDDSDSEDSDRETNNANDNERDDDDDNDLWF